MVLVALYGSKWPRYDEALLESGIVYDRFACPQK